MDLIDTIYANEMSKREESHATYLFQMQQWVSNDPYITENAWKYEVYAWLKNLGKKISDVSEEDIQKRAESINDDERRSQWLYSWALILSDFYGMPLRMAYDRDRYDWVPDDKFRMMKMYWRVSDAYYKYQIQEQWELEADGRVKQLDPVKSNEINKVDIDVTAMELQEWKKILQRLENKLRAEVDEDIADEIGADIEKAKKNIEDLSSKK